MSETPLLEFPEDESLRAAFEAFDRENPQVWTLFCRFCDDILARGRGRYGVASVFERIRWHVNVDTRGDAFKLNNNHRAFYARKWLALHPEHPDFFSVRQQRSA